MKYFMITGKKYSGSFHVQAVVLFSFLFFFALTLYSVAQEDATSNKSIFADRDQDGISDEEEKVLGTDPTKKDTDGDSYSDGVEIASGYDPLKPAPGDRLIPDKEDIINNLEDENNATKKLSTDLAAFVREKQQEGVGGLGNVEEISVGEITEQVQESLQDTVAFSDLPEVDTARVKIKDQRYEKLNEEEREEKIKEDDIEYFTSVAYILSSNSPERISDVSDVNNVATRLSLEIGIFGTGASTYLQDFAGKGKEMIKQMDDIEVPEKRLETHIKGLKLAQYSASLEPELEPNQTDPLASINTLAKMQGLMGLVIEFGNELNSTIENEGFTDLDIVL